MGAMNWISRWYDPKGDAGSDEIARTFADDLVGGLAAHRTADRPPSTGTR